MNISKVANVRYPLLRTGNIATQFDIRLNLPIIRIPLLQTAVKLLFSISRYLSNSLIQQMVGQFHVTLSVSQSWCNYMGILNILKNKVSASVLVVSFLTSKYKLLRKFLLFTRIHIRLMVT